jgi:hypothetical protein
MAITNGYATLNELKASLGINDNVDDTRLELAIETASREIDQFCNRFFYNAGTATRLYAADTEWLTAIDDAITITKLETSGDADGVFDSEWAATDYQKEPLNGVGNGSTGWPTTKLRAVGGLLFPKLWRRATIRVTGTWGWAAVPTAIKTATLLQAARIFKRADAPFGAAGFSDIGIIRVTNAIDPDVRQAIEPYILTRAIG